MTTKCTVKVYEHVQLNIQHQLMPIHKKTLIMFKN